MTDTLPSPHDRELAELRRGKRNKYVSTTLKSVAAFFGLLCFILLVVYIVRQYRGSETSLEGVHQQLLEINSPWATSLVEQQNQYHDWLTHHGTRSEVRLFDELSLSIAQNILSSTASSREGDEISTFTALYVAFHFGFQRILFLIIAAFRLWIVGAILAIFWGLRSFKPHVGHDVLGQMGNGRLFYSGIRAGLKNLSSSGVPDFQVRGLACLESVPSAQVRASELYSVLTSYQAANRTNEQLAAILCKYTEYPAFIPPSDEENLFSSFYNAKTPLKENARYLLEAVLSLHHKYEAGDTSNSLIDKKPSSADPLEADEYAILAKHALHRVLTQETRQALGKLSAAQVATIVLASECGKIMSSGAEGQRWFRISVFPHLGARAVLHSIEGYGDDYDFKERETIRRALIYAARKSAFAPVRMPIDLSDEAWAARQWVELFFTCPHELDTVADEVEMVGLIRHSNQRWTLEFLEGGAAISPDLTKQLFTTTSNLLFMPLAETLRFMRMTLTPAQIRRLEELVSAVNIRQKLQSATLKGPDGEEEVTFHEKVFPLFTTEEIATLAKQHALSEKDLKDWNVLRVVLNAYGWLARRVGDYTVPEGSVIYTVFKSIGGRPEANEHGLFGRAAQVPFRGTRLQEKWGKNWGSRFTMVAGVTMAEQTERYERLLRGIQDKEEPVDPELGVPAIA